MSHSVVITSANFSNYVDRAVPYLDQASGYYLFGGSFNDSKTNLAPPGGELTANGSPTYGAGYARLAALGDYFATGRSVSGGHTIIAVVSKAAGPTRAIGPAANTLGQNASALMRMGGAFGGTATASFDPGTAYGFVASTMVGSISTGGALYTPSGAGVLARTSAANTGANLPLQSVSIGHETAPWGAANAFNIAAAMFFDVELSQAQIETIYGYFRDKLPTRGIPVY